MSRRISQGAPSYADPQPDVSGVLNDPSERAHAPINDCSAEIAAEAAQGPRQDDCLPRSGVAGSTPGAAPELLNDGQEEVFSREEVERGHIEHLPDERGVGPAGQSGPRED